MTRRNQAGATQGTEQGGGAEAWYVLAWKFPVIRELLVALAVGGLVSGAGIWAQMHIDDRRSATEERRENLRFVRELSVNGERGKPLVGIDLLGQQLTGLDLRGARLDGAVLSESSLQFSRLDGANLENTVAVGAQLWGTQLPKANLTAGDFSSADFDQANLQEALLIKAVFSGANLRSVNLSGADVSGADFEGADLRGANFGETGVDGICYDDQTRWPIGFLIPDNTPQNCRSVKGDRDGDGQFDQWTHTSGS
ncbi:pentapeptide repeat-containing protein [Arthrobacter sp. Leaf234]|uniref:pentapeptide repeat-containing protein n=1 Tax=Arthrobacter sp. Leaf234 TaxID=1736303 RepID=UPI0009E84F83|nr:pentapeptide repeat-containing protein [Arthrobacter sp. Leaf234]